MQEIEIMHYGRSLFDDTGNQRNRPRQSPQSAIGKRNSHQQLPAALRAEPNPALPIPAIWETPPPHERHAPRHSDKPAAFEGGARIRGVGCEPVVRSHAYHV